MTNPRKKQQSKGELYEVEMFEEKRVEYPDKLRTFGLDTCMGVAILNTREKIGYLGHFISNDSPEFLINQAIGEAEDIKDLEIVIAGNNPLTLDDEIDSGNKVLEASIKYSREHSEFILDMIHSKGIDLEKLKNYLSNQLPYDSYEIEVDTETCKIYIEKEEI